MAGIKEETVTSLIFHVTGIILQELAEKHVNEISATHSTTGVTGLGLLDHRCSQNTDIVGCLVHQFFTVHCYNV